MSNSSELKSFLLIMCIDAPGSTTNSRSSGFVEVGAGITFASIGVKRVVLSEFLSLVMVCFYLHCVYDVLLMPHRCGSSATLRRNGLVSGP